MESAVIYKLIEYFISFLCDFFVSFVYVIKFDFA